MGATFVQYTVEGYDLRDCFDELKNEYMERFGRNNHYSGTIASCNLGYRSKTYKGEYSKKNENEANKIIRKEVDDDGCGFDKGILSTIDLGIVSYDVVTVKLKKYSNKPKYKLMFVVRDMNKIYFSSEDKKLAEDKLLSLALSHKNIELVKEYKLVEGSSLLATPEISVKSYKKRPEKCKGVLKEKHRYIFYGYAPE